MPPVSMVTDLPESDQWGAVEVGLPFGEVNATLGVQLDQCTVRADVYYPY
jgi:hypothetical protein